MPKATKQQAHYRLGTGKERCGLCSMFRPPSSCTAVKGKIDRQKVCDYFEPAKRITRRGERWYGRET